MPGDHSARWFFWNIPLTGVGRTKRGYEIWRENWELTGQWIGGGGVGGEKGGVPAAGGCVWGLGPVRMTHLPEGSGFPSTHNGRTTGKTPPTPHTLKLTNMEHFTSKAREASVD